MATRSAGPAFRASRASPVLPDASREALIDERGPAGLGHDDAFFPEAWENSTSRNGCGEPARLCAACADFNVLT